MPPPVNAAFRPLPLLWLNLCMGSKSPEVPGSMVTAPEPSSIWNLIDFFSSIILTECCFSPTFHLAVTVRLYMRHSLPSTGEVSIVAGRMNLPSVDTEFFSPQTASPLAASSPVFTNGVLMRRPPFLFIRAKPMIPMRMMMIPTAPIA